MPKNVSSVRTARDVGSALVNTADGHSYTVRPLWELSWHPRLRVANTFVGRDVEVEVWPNRTPDDPENRTYRFCRVLSAAHNPHWGERGTTVLVLEFQTSLTKPDLPVPTSQVHSIRTVDPTPEEEDDREDQL